MKLFSISKLKTNKTNGMIGPAYIDRPDRGQASETAMAAPVQGTATNSPSASIQSTQTSGMNPNESALGAPTPYGDDYSTTLTAPPAPSSRYRRLRVRGPSNSVRKFKAKSNLGSLTLPHLGIEVECDVAKLSLTSLTISRSAVVVTAWPHSVKTSSYT